MSILIFASVVSRLPAQGGAIWSEGTKVQFFTIIGIGIAMIVGIVFVESGQRRIRELAEVLQSVNQSAEGSERARLSLGTTPARPAGDIA